MLSAGKPLMAHHSRMDVSDQIRSARLKAGLSQRALAKLMGASNGAVARLLGVISRLTVALTLSKLPPVAAPRGQEKSR